MSSENIQLPLPDGNVITTKVVAHSDGSFTAEPVSNNISHIHHHYYVDGGVSNFLVRDREGFNQYAYVFQNGQWKQRSLTSKEKEYQWNPKKN